MKATKKYLLLVAACAALSVSAVAFTACGDSHTHTLTKTDEVPATCTENGTQAYWTCSDCEKMFSDAEAKHEIKAVVVIPASHTLTKTDEVSATCTADGAEAYWTCSACEKWFNDAEGKNENEAKTPVAIPAKGHKLTKTDEVPATCEEDGTAEYWTCSACEKKFDDAEGKNVITAPATIGKLGHDWNEEYVKTATSHYYTCKNDPTHHNNEAYHDDDGESGEDYTTCSVCGYKHTHTWGEYTLFNSTGHRKECTTGGNIHTTAIEAHDTDGEDGVCSKCGYKGIPTVTLTIAEGATTATGTIASLDGNGAKLVIEAEYDKFYQLSATQANVKFGSFMENPYTFQYTYYTATIDVYLMGGGTLTNVEITIEELPEVESVEIELDEEVTVSGAAYERPMKYSIGLEEGYYQIILNGETYTEGDDYYLAFGYYMEGYYGVFFETLYPDSQNRFEVPEGGDVYDIEVYEDVTFKVIKVEDHEGGDEEPDGTQNNPFTATTGETISVNIDAGLGINEVWFLFEATEGVTYTITINDEDACIVVRPDPDRSAIAYGYGTNCTFTLEAGGVVYINASHNNNESFTFTITEGGELEAE